MSRPDIAPAPFLRPLINVGAGLDIPNGAWITGLHGESILSGGLSHTVGYIGKGNVFKTTLADYMHLRAGARLCTDYMGKYDTESNSQTATAGRVLAKIPEWGGEDILFEGKWVISDESSVGLGNKFYEKMRDWWKGRMKEVPALMRETPFPDRDRKSHFKMPLVCFQGIDSLTRFKTEDAEEISTKNELGDKGANMIFARQGLSKVRMLSELPSYAARTGTYMYVTAHIGGTGPQADPNAPPERAMQFLDPGKKIKGATEQITFLTTDLYHILGAPPEVIKDSNNVRSARYPRIQGEVIEGDTDLVKLTIKNLRGKNGNSGRPIYVLASQAEGILPSLTEFYNIKETGENYGISGNNVTFTVDLYPDAKLMRTTVRNKLDTDPKLARAVNITSEMLQMRDWQPAQKQFYCTPAELRQGLIDRGYDWDFILTNTRGWWTFNGMHEDQKFLSTLDLLKMRLGLYIPYWMTDEEKAKIKKD